jgi:hypothetical protein
VTRSTPARLKQVVARPLSICAGEIWGRVRRAQFIAQREPPSALRNNGPDALAYPARFSCVSRASYVGSVLRRVPDEPWIPYVLSICAGQTL